MQADFTLFLQLFSLRSIKTPSHQANSLPTSAPAPINGAQCNGSGCRISGSLAQAILHRSHACGNGTDSQPQTASRRSLHPYVLHRRNSKRNGLRPTLPESCPESVSAPSSQTRTWKPVSATFPPEAVKDNDMQCRPEPICVPVSPAFSPAPTRREPPRNFRPIPNRKHAGGGGSFFP